MARPVKWRRVCDLPGNDRFGPLGLDLNLGDAVNMTIDEYEAIRLIDLEGLNQEECAQRMNVARTTVQGIYIEARRKLADSLVNGKALLIGGGEYRLCDGDEIACGRGCPRQEGTRGRAHRPGGGRGRQQAGRGRGQGQGRQEGRGQGRGK
ncbi:MAG: DUF134 domain-containing protein [Clostridiales bacterium]|nr:DUF134 domain-containing protein [Clostridiales bacterium]